MKKVVGTDHLFENPAIGFTKRKFVEAGVKHQKMIGKKFFSKRALGVLFDHYVKQIDYNSLTDFKHKNTQDLDFCSLQNHWKEYNNNRFIDFSRDYLYFFRWEDVYEYTVVLDTGYSKVVLNF